MRRFWIALALALPLAARQPVRGREAMVVAQDPIATDVGVQILKQGGNAIDAATAIGFALQTTWPFAGNIGGGGFMLIRFADGRTTFIDFREKAPAAASRDMYIDAKGNATRDSILGWRAAGVPGTVRGLELAHSKYGKLKWETVVRPSQQLAAKGFPVSYALAESLRGTKNISSFPDAERVYHRNGKPYQAGEIFVQPDLAKTLDRIARLGAKDFYEGETARLIATSMAANGGHITLADLRNYNPVERKPLVGKYGPYTVYSAAPPSSGGVGILQMLGMLDGSGYEKSGSGSAASIHYVAEAMRRFFADRSEYLGDTDFYKAPMAGLLDPAYIAKRRASIDTKKATPSRDIRPGGPPGAESSETTHFNVVDAQGNAVAMTYTINDGYGSGVMIPGAGFLMNDEMDDFASKPGSPNQFGLIQGEGNKIEPGKRPLSAMSPTILEKDGKFFMAVGAPGGPRIISAVLQVILNVVDFKMNAQEAVDAPRVHHQWMPDRLSVEHGISPDTVAILRGMGHEVDYSPGLVIASVETIIRNGEWLEGGADGRRNAKASGY